MSTASDKGMEVHSGKGVQKRISRRLFKNAFALLGLNAGFVAGVLIYASGYLQGRKIDYEVWFTLIFLAVNVLPFILMGLLVFFANRKTYKAMIAVGIGITVMMAVNFFFLTLFLQSESSTAALVFLGLPVYQMGIVVVTAVITVITHMIIKFVYRKR